MRGKGFETGFKTRRRLNEIDAKAKCERVRSVSQRRGFSCAGSAPVGHDAVRVVRVTHRLELRLDRREVTRLAARGVERGGVARGEAEEVQRGLRR